MVVERYNKVVKGEGRVARLRVRALPVDERGERNSMTLLLSAPFLTGRARLERSVTRPWSGT